MQKFIIAIAVAVFAFSTSMFAPAAHAGMKGKIAVGLAIGAIGVMAHQHRMQKRRAMKRRYHARRKSSRKRKSYVAKKKATAPKKQYVAEIAPEDVPLPVKKVTTKVVAENSSITTAALTDTDLVTDDVADVNDETIDDGAQVSANTANEPETVGALGCKKFFPSVGMTLSVPCEASSTQ